MTVRHSNTPILSNRYVCSSRHHLERISGLPHFRLILCLASKPTLARSSSNPFDTFANLSLTPVISNSCALTTKLICVLSEYQPSLSPRSTFACRILLPSCLALVLALALEPAPVEEVTRNRGKDARLARGDTFDVTRPSHNVAIAQNTK